MQKSKISWLQRLASLLMASAFVINCAMPVFAAEGEHHGDHHYGEAHHDVSSTPIVTLAATTATLEISTDKTTYTVGETMTITATATADGETLTDADLSAKGMNYSVWAQNTDEGNWLDADKDFSNGHSLSGASYTFTAAGTYAISAQLYNVSDNWTAVGPEATATVTVTEAGATDPDVPATGYYVTVTPEQTAITLGESVSITATIYKDGEKLEALPEGAELWFWPDVWQSGHEDGVEAKAADIVSPNSGSVLTVDVTPQQVGTYYMAAELQKVDPMPATKCVFTTITVTEKAADPGVPQPVPDEIEVGWVNLPDDFIMGWDISSIVAEYNSGVKFKDWDGNVLEDVDAFCAFIAEQGITHVRIRIWNDPFTADGKGYGGGNNDVKTAKIITEACAKAGLKVLLDFHLSDFWADPGKQMVPKAWKNYTLDQKAEATEKFIGDALKTIEENAKGTVDSVQVGNETTGSVAGESGAAKMSKIFSAGAKAIRDYSSDIKVVIHVTNPEKSNMTTWAKNLKDNNVDYDVLATSYYPYWHGTLANLKSQMSTVKETYGKDVMVGEISYAFTLADTDGWDNTVKKGNNDTGANLLYQFDVQGQASMMHDIIELVNEVGGLGVYYWEPAWITVGDTTGLTGTALTNRINENKKLWEEFGSGWASSYATEYDPNDAGKWYGGSAVDNQAFFDASGAPIASLKMWNLIKTTGSYSSAISVAEIESPAITVEQGDALTLPETVKVAYSNGSNVQEPVTWTGVDAIDTAKAGTYKVNGTVTFSMDVTDGEYAGLTSAPVTATVTVRAPNLIDGTDANFDSGANYEIGGSGISSIPHTKDDPYEGPSCMHWYRASAATGTVTYKALTLEPGDYNVEIMTQGDSGDTLQLLALDTAGKTLAEGAVTTLTGWANWKKATLTFSVEEPTAVRIQIKVVMKAGGWGTADCLYLYQTGTRNKITIAGDNGEETTVYVKDGATYTLPECDLTAPEGYTFAGWLVKGEFETFALQEKLLQPGETITVNGNITITAKWEEDVTVPAEVTLVKGSEMSTILKDSTSSMPLFSRRDVVFCDYEDLAGLGVDVAWTDGKDVDANNDGAAAGIRVFFNSDKSVAYVAVKAATEKIYLNADCKGMFSSVKYAQSISFSDKVDASRVTTMENMFNGLQANPVEITGLENWDVSNVTNMKNAFSSIRYMKKLDLSKWDVSKVTSFEHTFYGDYGLEELDLSGWKTTSATNMYMMFCYDESLKELDLRGFDFSKVTNAFAMFSEAKSLTTIYASKDWDNAPTNLGTGLFNNCDSLVGGNGTKFSAENDQGEYAKIDRDGTPGYFTCVHDAEEEIIPGKDGNCKTPGLTEGKKCSLCGKVTVPQEETGLGEHSLIGSPTVNWGSTPIDLSKVRSGEYLEGLTATMQCGVCYKRVDVTVVSLKTDLWGTANCTTKVDGYIYVTVSGYDKEVSKKVSFIDSEKHTKLTTLPGKDPTCTEPGLTEGQKCTACGVTTVPQEEIPASGAHELTYHAYVAATCTEDGNIDYWQCEKCGKYYVDEKKSEEGHTEAYEWVSGPDANGFWHVALTDHEIPSYDEFIFIPAQGHVCIKHQAKDPTCTEPGNKFYTECERCGKFFTGTDMKHERDLSYFIIPATGHTPGEPVRENVVEASCDKEGSYDEVVYCTVCGEELSRETKAIDKIAHTPGAPVQENRKEATCTAEGSYDEVVYCTVCGAELSRETKSIDKIPHTPGEPVRENVVEASCDKEGSYDEVVYCTVCKTELSREKKTINKIAHTPGEPVRENVVEASCDKEGSYDEVVYCSVCKTELSREKKTINKIEHTPGEAVRENVVESTCTKEGSYDEVVYCSVCDEELSREKKTIAKLPHTPGEPKEENRKEATCTEDGSYEEATYCTVCGEELSRKTVVIPATGHKWGEPAWTWSEDGKSASATFTCTNDAAHTKTVEATVTSEVTTAPTCVTMGWTTYTATVVIEDGMSAAVVASTEAKTYTATKTVEDIPALGHDITTEWSKAREGHWHYCTRCGEKFDYTEHTSDILGIVPGVEPTATEEGWTAYVECSICHQHMEEPQRLPPLNAPDAIKPAIPQTGDESNPTLWVVLGGVSVVALIVLVVLFIRRKRNEKED